MNTSRKGTVIGLLLVMSFVLAACSDSTSSSTTVSESSDTSEVEASGELTPVVLGMPNQRSIQYHPVYVAKEAGFFEDEGLDVSFEVVSGSGATIQQLIAGNVDLALMGQAAIVQASSTGQELVTFCTTHYQNINTMVATEASGITDIEGLQGGIVGISEASGGEVPFVRFMLASAGLTEGEDYEMLAVGDGGQLTYEALESGDVDSYSSSVFDVAAVESAGLPLNYIVPDEFLFVPSIGLSATKETFDNDADMLEAFGRAYAKGQVFAAANRDAANEMGAKYDPELYEDPEFRDAIWTATERLMTPPEGFDASLICTHYQPAWEAYIEAASEGDEEEGALGGPVDLGVLLDSSLIEGINDFDQEAVEAEAEAYEPAG